MRSPKAIFFAALAVAFGVLTAFFTFFGVQLIYAALTFTGEGSLGHVGMYIAAVLYPLLAIFFGGLAFLAWRKAFRNRPATLPPNQEL
jgi:protein-S-isoprenylcysteine O-methyltransferase Ste14